MYRPLPLFVGLRYTRAKRRNHFISFISLISMLGIALGVIALILVLSVMNGFHKEVRARILGMTSHATILGYGDGIRDWPSLVRAAREHPEVIEAAPYVEFQAMLMHGQSVSGVMVRGILPSEEVKVSEIGDAMVQGGLDGLVDRSYQLVLGKELALDLGVAVGDQVTLVAPNVAATPVGMMPRLKRFSVAGIFEVGMGEYDRGIALVSMTDAARVMRLGDQVTGVRLKMQDLYRAPTVSRQVAVSLPSVYRVVDWTMRHRNFFQALQMEKRMMSIILFLIVAVAAFNIVSTLVMMVTDKQSDIAILRTLGFGSGEVMWVFITQGTLIGLVGTLLGLAAGIPLAFNLEAFVAWIEGLFGIRFLDPNIYYISRLPSDVQWADVSAVASGAFLLSLLATLYPAWRAGRTQPVEALRYE